MKSKILITLLLVWGYGHSFYGQVVLGGATYPVEGALLDIKEYQADAENTTATKGLLLPRVKLSDLSSLKPMVQIETEANKKEHIGLQVYHIGDDEILEGVKTWNGSIWTGGGSAEQDPWIYMPAFPIQMYKTTEQKIDLYEEYKKQLGTVGARVIWEENEVKFVVTAYDTTVFSTAPTVKTENGKQYLVYKAIPNKLTASSYLNIIIVKI
ncbi:hypothetical protein [Myroides odoratus]|jgi:hypothetical protein|uniref:Uncharacterized protein n=1 Tax=Myroides odoratus TaxID=256 RepID=A0A9Q6ZCC0_MYROD|nr:hypothetical protein [Myroides odoratus]EHQ41210.1 hypothetical protein Myrod_0372 [Myroides odoratus DSM 2801]EKB08509.1 hypothetical protein HMPREF9716_00973 [Myroides odoratus CIP 103059]QQT98659.1 hypothetical protein I6I88_10530 [Myroides odoratus]WQD59167.1 hypothetical protein U0010_08445 [Myroides odoratus]STZ32247.1 Uncharacterised protein [Myroides odoratus]